MEAGIAEEVGTLRQSVTILRCTYTDRFVLHGHKLLKRTYAMTRLRNIGKIFLVN